MNSKIELFFIYEVYTILQLVEIKSTPEPNCILYFNFDKIYKPYNNSYASIIRQYVYLRPTNIYYVLCDEPIRQSNFFNK